MNNRRGWNIIEGGGKDHVRREVRTLSSAPPLPTASTNTTVHPTTMIQTAILYCFQDATIRISSYSHFYSSLGRPFRIRTGPSPKLTVRVRPTLPEVR